MAAKHLLCRNVCGLNAKAHKDAMWDLVRIERASFICIQETKLDVISDFDIVQILGTGFEYF
jgi:exonuclease III